MKNILFVLLTSLVLTSTAFAQKTLPTVTAPEAQILQYITDVRSFTFDPIAAKVITTSSFAEPEQVTYLVLAKTYGFDPEENNAAIYNLQAALGAGTEIEKIEKKAAGLLLTITNADGKRMRTVFVRIHGLEASL